MHFVDQTRLKLPHERLVPQLGRDERVKDVELVAGQRRDHAPFGPVLNVVFVALGVQVARLADVLADLALDRLHGLDLLAGRDGAAGGEALGLGGGRVEARPFGVVARWRLFGSLELDA